MTTAIRRLCVCLPLAMLGVLLFASTSFGQATPGKFSIISPINGIEADFVCQPAPIGIITGTETVLGEFIPTSQGIHYHFTSTQDYRIDFADGSYLVSSSPTHLSFNSTGRGEVNTEVQQDRGSLYSASGQLIGIVSVFSVSHTTWIDANGNGFPDPGELTADVSKFRVSCP